MAAPPALSASRAHAAPGYLRPPEGDHENTQDYPVNRQHDEYEQRIPDDQGRHAECRARLECDDRENQGAYHGLDRYQRIERLYDLGRHERREPEIEQCARGALPPAASPGRAAPISAELASPDDSGSPNDCPSPYDCPSPNGSAFPNRSVASAPGMTPNPSALSVPYASVLGRSASVFAVPYASVLGRSASVFAVPYASVLGRSASVFAVPYASVLGRNASVFAVPYASVLGRSASVFAAPYPSAGPDPKPARCEPPGTASSRRQACPRSAARGRHGCRNASRPAGDDVTNDPASCLPGIDSW